MIQASLFDESAMRTGATISGDGTYRYELWRTWDASAPVLAWVMLNPSTADAEADDPTIRRCIGFARRWHFGGIRVVNLFALRATDPRELREHGDPVGQDNDRTLAEVANTAEALVCAWGANTFAAARAEVVHDLIGDAMRWPRVPLCLGVTKGGAPRHPLYVPGGTVHEGFGGSW
jgi:hypothetical protein